MNNKEIGKRGTRKKAFILILILLIAGFFRFYQINRIPGEIFGDMAKNLENIEKVLAGEIKVLYSHDYNEGLFFILAAPLAKIFGNTYLTLKAYAAGIGTLAVIPIYLLGKELFNSKIGLIAGFFLAISKWPVIFSRVGFRNILAVPLTSLVFYFLIRTYRYKEKLINYFLLGLCLGIGIYTYTAFLAVLPVIFLYALYAMIKNKNTISAYLITLVVFLIVASPMIIDFIHTPQDYLSHPGQIFYREESHLQNIPATLLKNLKKQLLMLHGKGDIVFRVNPVNDPQLDRISGILFIIGAGYLFFSKKLRGQLRFILVPFFFLQLPSVLTLANPIDVPSATRSICVIPFVYLITAVGLAELFRFLKLKLQSKRLAILISAVLLLVISIYNYHLYFHKYAYGLPNHNTPIGKIIAQNIDRLPKETNIYITDCCWGDWGQPEIKGIKYALKTSRSIKLIHKTPLEQVKIEFPYFIIISPKEINKQAFFENNFSGKIKTITSKYDEEVVTFFYDLSSFR